MTMFLYPEQTICSNVTYGLLGTTVFANKKSLRDLSGHTVIIVTDELANDNLSLLRECQRIVSEDMN